MTAMTAPSSGVKVRMYRQGHGDCFLLAFPGRSGRKKRPVYILIDCGLKPKSEVKGQKIDRIIADIAKATSGYIDIVVVTHEHQDHVNGFLARARTRGRKPAFDPIRIGRVWLAWTEDGKDKLANELRKRFKDTLVALAFANQSVRKAGMSEANTARAERLQELLDLEIGDDAATDALLDEIDGLRTAAPDLDLASVTAFAVDGIGADEARRAGLSQLAAKIKGITNKRAIKYLRDKAEKGVTFMRPDKGPYELPDVADVNVFAFGPPRDVELLLDLDPREDEEFKLARRRAPFALDGASKAFLAAFENGAGARVDRSPFPNRYVIGEEKVHATDAPANSLDDRLADRNAPMPAEEFYRAAYGGEEGGSAIDPNTGQNEDWRRIEDDWLEPAEALALRLNDEVNNTSLVLAFELPRSKRVLLFTGDAQRGNWISWAKLEWKVGGKTVSARDLAGRCVFYKTGHHGSHNATLNGTADDNFPNLGWFALGDFRDEFVAMIPANTAWATTKSRPWLHPLPSIAKALDEKARGRVFRSDVDRIAKPSALSASKWRTFQQRTVEKDLYFEYTVLDR